MILSPVLARPGWARPGWVGCLASDDLTMRRTIGRVANVVSSATIGIDTGRECLLSHRVSTLTARPAPGGDGPAKVGPLTLETVKESHALDICRKVANRVDGSGQLADSEF